MAAGWKLVALEWERRRDEAVREQSAWEEAIPYGLQISGDCSRLVENPGETQVIVEALHMIVDDFPLSRVASQLNRQGYTMRDGRQWTMTALFDLLPRMIQVGPRIFSSEKGLTCTCRGLPEQPYARYRNRLNEFEGASPQKSRGIS